MGLSPNDCDTLNQNDFLYQAIFGSHPGLSCDEVGKQWAADGAGCAWETFFPVVFPYAARAARFFAGRSGTGYDHGTTACTLGRLWSTGIQAGAAAYSAIDLIPTSAAPPATGRVAVGEGGYPLSEINPSLAGDNCGMCAAALDSTLGGEPPRVRSSPAFSGHVPWARNGLLGITVMNR